MSWDPCFLSSDTHWMYMNAHKSKLLFKPSCLSSHLFLSSVLIPPPLGFLTIFFVQNLNFSKSFHVNPKLEFTKLFWTCKMTNTRRFYNCTFTLTEQGECLNRLRLDSSPLGLFRVKAEPIFEDLIPSSDLSFLGTFHLLEHPDFEF